mgnify:CR=1 FL=1
MSNKLIDIVNISKAFDENVVLDELNLYIRENEFLTLLGPSGCGKTTLLRILGGFETPDSGKIIFDGQDITNLAPNKRQLNTVFQKYALFTHMTIAENIAFGLKIKGKSQNYINDKIRYALKLVNLEGFENRTPASLSGGQQQRIAIARAIVNEPKVLLLDEPLGALDLKLRQDMQYELIRLKNELGITFIYVTHDQTEAMTLGDRIIVMNQGVVQQADTPQNLYDMPCNMFVAGFIGSPQMNFLDGTLIKKGELYGIDLGGDVIPLPKEKTADGKLDAYVGKKVKMGIRPEDIDDEPEFMAKHTDCQLEAQVEVSEMMGAEIYLYLEYKGNKMTARVAPTSKARNGDTVRVAFDPHKVHLFDIETEQTILN